MKYSTFLEEYEKSHYPGQIVLRDTSINLDNQQQMSCINLPTFYSDVAELEAVEVMQGQGFKDKPKYIKKE